MINIDTRILDHESGLNESELWLLLHIVKRLDSDASCFPSNARLLKDTGWARQKLKSVKRSLQERGYLEVVERFKEDRQTSNKYRLKTSFISVFVTVTELTSYGIQEGEGDENHPGGGVGKSAPPEGDENHPTEVLTREEVLNEDSKKESSGMSDNTSDGKKPKPTKQKKEANPVFVACVDFWLKEFHPGWGFKAVDGKSLNSLIDSMRSYSAKKNGWSPSDDHLVNFFKHFCKELPDFYRSQDLRVLASKFDSIIEQIKNGRRKSITSPASAASVIRGL